MIRMVISSSPACTPRWRASISRGRSPPVFIYRLVSRQSQKKKKKKKEEELAYNQKQ